MKKIFICFCFIVLSFEVIVLSIKNQYLTKTMKDLEYYINDNKIPSAMNLFISLKNISNWNNKNKVNIFRYKNNKKSIIFYLSSTCSSCDEAAIYWNNIYIKHENKFNFFGISRDEEKYIALYIKRNNIQFPVYKINDNNEEIELILDRTPKTIIMDNDGSVIEIYENKFSKLEGRLMELEKK